MKVNPDKVLIAIISISIGVLTAIGLRLIQSNSNEIQSNRDKIQENQVLIKTIEQKLNRVLEKPK